MSHTGKLVWGLKTLLAWGFVFTPKLLSMTTKSNQGKKITLFLVNGEPDGIKMLNLGGWNGTGLMFPRNKLKEAGAEEVTRKPGVYFLFGKEAEDSLVTAAYIGEAENIFDRLTTHNHDKNKEFWYMTVVFVSNDDTVTKAHVKYLESRCAQLAYEAKHFGYTLKNGKESLPASLPRADVPVMEEFVNNVSLLLATIGYPILQKPDTKADLDQDNPLVYCQSKDGSGKGVARMTNEGFIMYKGSTATVKISKSIAERNQKVITKLLSGDVIKETDAGYTFEKDHVFTSPSTAACLIVGFSINGWDAWKTEDGKTLDQLYRHNT